MAGRHGEVGEAEPRARDSGVGRASASSAINACWCVRTPPSAPRCTTTARSPARRRRSSPCPTRARVQSAGYTIQVAPEDCTGCNLCVNVCPAKDRTNPRHKAIDMHPQAPLRDAERDNYAFFLDLPDTARVDLPKVDHKTSQFLEPLFEYSGACAGCGETPYIKLLTQLFGDRASWRTPRAARRSTAATCRPRRSRRTTTGAGRRGRTRCSRTTRIRPRHAPRRTVIHARRALVEHMAGPIGERLTRELLGADQSTEAGIRRSASGCARCDRCSRLSPRPKRRLEALADYLVKKSIWLVGATGGPTTSGTAASTTSWPASAT